MRAIAIAVFIPMAALTAETADAAGRRRLRQQRPETRVPTSTTVTATRATTRVRVRPMTATAPHCIDTTVLTATDAAVLRTVLTSLFEHAPCVAGEVRLRISPITRDIGIGVSYLTVVMDGQEIVVMGLNTHGLARQVAIEVSLRLRSTRAPHATSPERPP